MVYVVKIIKIEYKGNIERIIKAKSRFFNDYLNR